jgi:signal transduction histidine kinase
LHDGPLQELTALGIDLSLLAAGLREEEKVAQVLALRAKHERTTRQLRQLAQELRPPMLAHFGLAAAIRAYAERLYGVPPPVLELEGFEESLILPDHLALPLYRICQQAMQNTRQHAEASLVRLHQWVEDDQVWLEVADDGKGFTLPAHWLELAREGHLGLVGMRERAEALGGHLDIQTAAGQGTVVRVHIPLTDASPIRA